MFDFNTAVGCRTRPPYLYASGSEHHSLAPLIDPGITGSESRKARQAVERFHGLLAKVGVETSLKELGVRAESLDAYAEDLVKKYYRARNPRPMSQEEARKLVEAMWERELREI